MGNKRNLTEDETTPSNVPFNRSPRNGNKIEENSFKRPLNPMYEYFCSTDNRFIVTKTREICSSENYLTHFCSSSVDTIEIVLFCRSEIPRSTSGTTSPVVRNKRANSESGNSSSPVQTPICRITMTPSPLSEVKKRTTMKG